MTDVNKQKETMKEMRDHIRLERYFKEFIQQKIKEQHAFDTFIKNIEKFSQEEKDYLVKLWEAAKPKPAKAKVAKSFTGSNAKVMTSYEQQVALGLLPDDDNNNDPDAA